jgi:membrane protein implicated in regulation of membrane protease activity
VQVNTPVNVQKNSSLGTAALVCGILGICGGAIEVVNYFTFILSILAIVFGKSVRKKAKYTGQPTGAATAGMVLGIIGVVLSIIVTVLTGAFFYLLF